MIVVSEVGRQAGRQCFDETRPGRLIDKFYGVIYG